MSVVNKLSGSFNKYETLLGILDKISEEASENLSVYHPPKDNIEKVNQARARSYIHLFLKVKFGLIDFTEREALITDGTEDGGIDAYYIDSKSKKIYIIQSKFRTNEKNYREKEIEMREILNMDVSRVIGGNKSNATGRPYNGKVVGFINKLSQIDCVAQYKYVIVIIANLKSLSEDRVLRLTDGTQCEIYDHERCYKELVFPVVTGTFYNAEKLAIEINLANKDTSNSNIGYPVEIDGLTCDINIIFVPTLEIAKVLHKYKNSILKYNPRSYLSLSENPVNKEIARTIEEKKSNEFSLFNNGITILSDETDINTKIGRLGKGQILLVNPQIINGGQTAYTLSKIYEKHFKTENIDNIFAKKEVMLRIITISRDEGVAEETVFKLIEDISKATNRQTKVDEMDRHANDAVQQKLQDMLFNEFGYFYERKRGEFFDGLEQKYINPKRIINRGNLLRAAYAMSGAPNKAMSSAEEGLADNFGKVIEELGHNKVFFGCMCLTRLFELDGLYKRSANNKYGVATYGNAIRYGKMAVVFAASLLFHDNLEQSEIEAYAVNCTNTVLSRWSDFETFVKKQPHNSQHFKQRVDPDTNNIIVELHFVSFYKGSKVQDDIKEFYSDIDDIFLSEIAAATCSDE